MRRQSSPHDFPGETQAIEILGAIARDSPRQNFGLPGHRRNLVTLKLLDHLQRAVHAVQTASRPHVLPAAQEAQKIRGRYRLDLAPQTAESQAVNAREDAA